jgi:gliding motility-associated-like protein
VFVGISPISYGDTLIEVCVGDAPFAVVPVNGSCVLRNQSGDPVLNNIFSPTTPGDFIFSYPCRNAANCTSNSTITVRVRPRPTAVLAPRGATIKCVGDTVELEVANPRTDFFYQLQRRPLAGGVFTDIGQPGDLVFYKITNPGVYRVSVTGQGCTNVSNEIEVNFNALPVVNAGADLSICPTGNGTLQLTPTTGTGGVWTGSPRISPSGLYDYDLFRGCDTLTYTVINANGCRGEDSRIVCVKNEPQISFNVTDAASCTDSNGVVTAVLAQTGRYRFGWQRVFPTPTITYTVNQNTLTGLKPGNYRVTVFDTLTQCSAQATATVGPILFNAEIIGLPLSVCANVQPIPLAGLPLGTSRQFTGIPGSQRVRLINNQFVFDPRQVGPFAPDADTVIYTTLIEGCLGQARKAITVTPVPTVNAGLDTAVCSGAIFDLIPEGNFPGGFWTGPGVLPDNKFSLNVITTTTVNVCYNFIPQGCDTVRDCRAITVRPNPSFVTQVIQNVSQCGGNNGIARVDSLNAPQNFNITWFRQTNAIATGILATNLTVGVYRAVVTNPVTGCVAERTAAITGPGNITLNDSCINILPAYCREDATVLLTSGCTNDLSNVTWTVGGINVISNPPQFNPINFPAGPLSIVLRGTDAVGCTVLTARNTTIINNPPVNPPLIVDTICAPFGNVILGGFNPIPGVWGPVSDTLSANGVFNASVGVPKTYNFTYTVGNQCTATGTYRLTVLARPPKPIVTPASSPAAPLTICDGQSITVAVSNTVSGGSYNWVRRSVPGGPVGTLNPQLTITTAGTYGVTTSIAGCTSEPSDDIVVLSNFTPTITNAGSPIDTCTDGNPIPLSNGITVVGFPNNPTVTVTWQSDVAGGTPETCVANGVFNPTCTAQPGTYRAMLIARSGGCADTAFRTVVLNRAVTPVIDPVGLVEFCEGSPVNITVSPNAPASHLPLYRWTVGGVPIADTGRVLTPTVSGVYRSILSFNGKCARRSIFGATVNIKPLPNVQVPGDISLCENDELFQLINFSPANGFWSSPSCSGVVSSGGIVDPSRVQAPANCTLLLTASLNGCESVDSIKLEVKKAVDVNVSSPNNETVICDGTSILLSAFPTAPDNTYQWFFNDTVIVGAIGATFEATRTGRYTVRVESPGQCAGINSRNPFNLTVTPPPSITTNEPFSICENGSPVQLFALPEGGVWEGQGVDSRNVFNPANVGEIPPDGIVNLTYRITTGCQAQKVLPVRVFDIPVLEVTPEQTVEVREPVNLFARGGVQYSWSPASLFTDTALAEQIVRPQVTTTYFAKVTDANGCVQSVSIRINVDDEFKIYDGFSPNGDGVNDTWEIKNIRRFPQAVIKIYNRWGNLVFESKDGYEKPWDGTKDGKELPAGAYYYNIVLGEGLAPINGSITLLR